MLETAAVSEARAERPQDRAAKSEASLRSPDDFLRMEFEAQQALFQVQPKSTQRWLEAQARSLSEGIIQGLAHIRFSLPNRVVIEAAPADGLRLGSSHTALVIPADTREHVVGGLWDHVAHAAIARLVRRRFTELELSPDRAIAVGAALLRYATATYMVHAMLPAGRSVRYAALPGEEISTIPVEQAPRPDSALVAATDALAEGGNADEARGELVVPYVPAARRFYLPQWVILDDQGRLLVDSVGEAEATLGSMQRFLAILHTAFALAPYILADETYQQKRYGMLGQLINQGRALARYKTGEIIRTMQRRAAANDLNRGLRLSLPYFDDRDLQMKLHHFVVIPAGRIMFIPTFVVRAAREEQAKVAQDTRLSASTRKHLLGELKAVEQAFDVSSKSARNRD